MSVIKNQKVICNITGISSEGYGVSKVDGFAVFVPMALPGETVEVLIIKVHKTYAFGKLLRILDVADCRIDIDCPVAGKCGGCAYRHADYQAELEFKRQRVEQAMRKIACSAIFVPPVLASERTEGYRNKAQIPIGCEKNGNLVTGFFAKNSHRIIENDGCNLSNPVFEEITKLICDFAEEKGITPYNEEKHKGLLRHLYFRIGDSTGEIMVCIVINGTTLPHCSQLTALIEEKYPQVKSIYININKKNTNVILGDEFRLIYGEKYITDILCGNKFFISPQSFYQVNKPQAEKLYQTALDMLSPKGNDVLLDLYCGIGTITLTAASRCKEIIGVEIIPRAVEDATRTAEANGITNASFFCADAGVPLSVLTSKKYDAVILDPPRKGITPQLASDLCASGIPKILYISCGPETLARDIGLLCDGGYTLQAIQPVDLFPRTSHIETIALLHR